MKVSFLKNGPRRYAVHVTRERYPDLFCGSIGYDDRLPHDLLHFVAESEYGLDGGVFGDLASGGNARIFTPVDKDLVAKMWRRQRIKPTPLPDGRRSEEPAGELERGLEEQDAARRPAAEARRPRREVARAAGRGGADA